MTQAQIQALLKLTEGPQGYHAIKHIGANGKSMKTLVRQGLVRVLEEKPLVWELTDAGRREAAKHSPIPDSSGSVG